MSSLRSLATVTSAVQSGTATGCAQAGTASASAASNVRNNMPNAITRGGERLGVAAHDRFTGDVAESEARADGRAGADGFGADRARHGDARAIETADHALVGTQHLAMPVGARPALGAEARVEEGRG